MIFLVGPHGAGKTKSSEIMCKFCFYPIDLGPALRKIHIELEKEVGFTDWIKHGEKKFGIHFTDEVLVQEISKLKKRLEADNGYIDLTIVGSRSIVGIEKIRTAIPNVNGHGNTIIFIDAPFNILLERYSEREGINLDIEGFKDLLVKDQKIGIDSIRTKADFTICNRGGEAELEAELKDILFKKLGYEKRG